MRWVEDERGETLPKKPFAKIFSSTLKVIEGLDLVVQSMYKNELAIISIKAYNKALWTISINLKSLQPPLAYGDLGRKPDIPPDSRITYLFGLLHFEKQKEMAEMTWAQVVRMSSQCNESNWNEFDDYWLVTA